MTERDCLVWALRLAEANRGRSTWHLLHVGPGNSWDYGTNAYVMVWQNWKSGEFSVFYKGAECEGFLRYLKSLPVTE